MKNEKKETKKRKKIKKTAQNEKNSSHVEVGSEVVETVVHFCYFGVEYEWGRTKSCFFGEKGTNEPVEQHAQEII
jgi:hypothetical protein